jgi:RNA polymerase sigma-70 factor, ECF subfamily
MSQIETGACTAGASSHGNEKMPDKAVAHRVRAGETALYEVLVRRHNSQLRRAAHRILSNFADVEEVIQEAHFNALHFIEQFSGRSSFSSWLTRIVINVVLSRLRHRSRLHDSSRFSSVNDPLETVLSAQPDPERQMLGKETREALDSAVPAQPKRHRAVFFLRKVREPPTPDVAVMLDISEECAKTRLHRAKVLLCRSRFLRSYFPLPAGGRILPRGRADEARSVVPELP